MPWKSQALLVGKMTFLHPQDLSYHEWFTWANGSLHVSHRNWQMWEFGIHQFGSIANTDLATMGKVILSKKPSVKADMKQDFQAILERKKRVLCYFAQLCDSSVLEALDFASE